MHIEEGQQQLHRKEGYRKTANVVQLKGAIKICCALARSLGSVESIGYTDLLNQLSGYQWST